MHRSVRRVTVLGVLVVALATATACSSSKSTSGGSGGKGSGSTQITFQLNYQAGGPNAGFAAAVAEGYYADAGLNVKLVQGNGSSTTAQLVGQNHAPLGYADAVAASQVIAKGAPVKVVSTIYQANPEEIASLKSENIHSINDLKGKTIGAPSGLAGTEIFPIVLAANGLSTSDVKITNVAPTSLVPALLRHQVDAILSGVDSYSVQAQLQGGDLNHMTYASLGVPTVSTSIVANTGYLQNNGPTVTKFIAASLKGWDFAIHNVDKAVVDIKKVFPQMQETPKQATLELQGAIGADLFCAGGAKYLGKAEPAEWTKTQQQAGQVGLISTTVDITGFYTNQYLPADSELTKCPVS